MWGVIALPEWRWLVIPKCPICGKRLFSAQHGYRDVRVDKVYCSSACKQKAYRQRCGTDPVTARQRAVETKQGEEIIKSCAWCGEHFVATVAAAKQKYCSAACKQAAYRARRVVV